MLKLIKCEFLKLKRKKFIPLIILAAFLFPIPLTYLMTTPSMMERYTDQADAFDGLFNMVLGYGIQFLLPCIIGVIAAILFFMERDNDTFKNLRTIPVTSTQMVLAKIVVLFLFGIVFCVASTIATILCGFGTFVYGYGGMFAAGNMTLANLYPITASLGMVGYRSYDTAVNWNIGTCSCSLVLAVVISAILILCMKEREATQTKKKAKKVAPKKGW